MSVHVLYMCGILPLVCAHLYCMYMYVWCAVCTCMYGVLYVHVCMVYCMYMYVWCTVCTCMYGVLYVHVHMVYCMYMYVWCTVCTCMYGVLPVLVCLLIASTVMWYINMIMVISLKASSIFQVVYNWILGSAAVREVHTCMLTHQTRPDRVARVPTRPGRVARVPTRPDQAMRHVCWCLQTYHRPNGSSWSSQRLRGGSHEACRDDTLIFHSYTRTF